MLCLYHSRLHTRSPAHFRRLADQWRWGEWSGVEVAAEAGAKSMDCQVLEVALGWHACRMSLTETRAQSRMRVCPRAI